ncbi:MAG: hypothetical protein E7480_00270 [Ruminococcaceae bacterium]|nr:hypothetical protein [Oscillospiraceae bacterium]
MLALVYVKYDRQRGAFAKLLRFLFPCVLKSIKENMAIYEAYMPLPNGTLTKRCEKKLIAEMKRDKISKFLCTGGCRKLLEDNGFTYAYSENYLKKNLFKAIKSLSCELGENAKKLKICICEKDKSITASDLLTNCAKSFENVTLITQDVDGYSDIQDEIALQYGAATIVTQSYQPAENADILICLSLTDEIFKNARISNHTVIITVDKDFLPKAYLQSSVITAFSKPLSSAQAELCKGSITPWEISCVLDEQNSDTQENSFTNFYSFGRMVTPKTLLKKNYSDFVI